MGGLVNKAVRLSLSLQYGAGGISISPSLTLRGMKQRNLPVFVLLKTLDLDSTRKGFSEWARSYLELSSWCRVGKLHYTKSMRMGGRYSMFVAAHPLQKILLTPLQDFFARTGVSNNESEPIYREPRDFFIKSLCYLGFSSNEESGVGMFREG